jgi:hypothetical protein
VNPTREVALFRSPRENPVEKRSAFLDVMGEGDPAFRQRLEASLAAHEQLDLTS